MPTLAKPDIIIRDITSDDIERVHNFILKEQGEAEFECDERYIQAIVKKGWLKIEDEISRFSKEEYEKKTRVSKTDFILDR